MLSTGKNSGFTLTEMMVTVGIMAVVSSVAAFNVLNRSPQYRIEQAQYQVLSDLRNARMEAVGKSTTCRVTFNNSAKTYNIWLDLDRDSVADSGETTTKSLAGIGGGVSLYTSPTVGTFTSRGTFTCSGSYGYQYVQLYSTYGYRIIYIFQNGQVDPYQWSS